MIHLAAQRTLPGCSAPPSLRTQAIFNCIRYSATSDPQIYLSYGLSAAQLLEWLDEASSGKALELPSRSISKQSPEENLLWFNSNSFHRLSRWLANEVQKSILKFYFTRKNGNPLRTIAKYIQEKGAQKSVMHLLEITLAEVSAGMVEKWRVEVEVLHGLEEKFKQDCESRLMKMGEDVGKKRKRRRVRHKKSDSKEKEESSVEREKGSDNKSPEKVPIDLKTAQANDQNTKERETTTEISSPMKSSQKSSQRTCSCEEYSQQEAEKCKTLLGEQIFEEAEEKDSECDEVLTESADQRKRRRRRKAGKNTSKAFEEFKQKATLSLLNKQLDKLLDRLSTESNSQYDSKVIAFERVSYFIRSMYPCAQANLFGSNAVGLSLPSSDIDVMLVGLPFSTKEEQCDYLAHIAVYINSMGWIISCSTYLGAKVPLLKLQIDTSVAYLTPKIKLDYHQAYDPYLSSFLDLRDSSKGAIIKVDITVSADIDRVSPSTELMRSWLHEKPSLQRVLLALKYTLAVRGYSENFKGGIGSYCLFLMVASYFQHFDQRRDQSDCEILLDVLRFYGQQFENHLKAICLRVQNQPCFLSNEQALQMGITQQVLFNNSLKIIDPLNGKLTSSSCYQYSSIKTEWRRIREEILKISEQVEGEISKSFPNSAELTKTLHNQKALDKWVNRLHTRLESSVGTILKGQF